MEIYDIVEMCDLPGKDHTTICKDRQDENPSLESQDVDERECHMDSDKPSRDIFVHPNETTADGVNHGTKVEQKNTDQKELMADSTTGVFPPSPPPPPFSYLPPSPAHTRSDKHASLFGGQRTEFRDETRLQRPNGGNWRNSFYVRLSFEFIACSTVLAIVIPVLGIPAVVYSIRSYRAYKRGGLQQSRHLNLLAFRLILVAGALLCCLAMVSGFLTAYILVRPIQIVSTEPPTMEVRSAASPQSDRNLFHVQGRELLDGRHNVSVLCQSGTKCGTSHSSISLDQVALPLDDPSWNPPEPLATLVRRAGMKVLKSPVVTKASRGSG